MSSITDTFLIVFETGRVRESGEITVRASTPVEAIKRLDEIFPGFNLKIIEMQLKEAR